MRWTWLFVPAVVLGPVSAYAGDVVSENSSEPYPGVTLLERTEANPNNRIRAAYVSLCHSGVSMTATAPATGFRTPGGWGSEQGVQLAVNGDFFTSGPQVYGTAVGGGVPWPLAQTGDSQPGEWYYQRYGWIAFGDGWVEFNHTERTKLQDAELFGVSMGWRPSEVTTDVPSGTEALVSGFPELVIEGQTYTCSSPTADDCFPDRSDMRARHPRTAMGLTEDRSTLILVTVDGRDSPSSVGMYGSELAELMAQLGAWEAFNLDGGGSTAMWLAGSGYVNEPSDGSARSVANHWGVFASGGDEPAGSCFAPGGCFPTILAGTEDAPFGDLPAGSYAYEEANALLDAGVLHGCRTEPRRMFCPNCGLTRAQAAAIVVNAAGEPAKPPATPTFEDVSPDSALYGVVEAAVAAGFMTGCAPDLFCPGDPVPRAELAGITRRAVGWEPSEDGDSVYDDLSPGDAGFGDVQSLVEHCIDAGCDDDSFCPDDPAQRDEAAFMVARAFGLVAVEPCAPAGETDGGGGASTSGGDGGGAGTGGSGDAGGSATTGTASGSSGSGALPDANAGGDAGCGCVAANRRCDFAGLLLLLGVVGLRRRR